MSVQLGDLVFEPNLHFHPRLATAARSRGPVDLLIFVGGEEFHLLGLFARLIFVIDYDTELCCFIISHPVRCP
jgi:hypothetical protein